MRKRLGLAELVGIELTLERDRERALEELHARDREIAASLPESALEAWDDAELSIAWVRALQSREGRTSGRRLVAFLDLLTLVLVALGLLLGFAGVAGWLLLGDGRPVNVVNFWPVFAGFPLLLAIAWALTSARVLRRLRDVARGEDAIQGFGVLLPQAAAAGFARLLGFDRGMLGEIFARLRELDWLYGKLRYWRTALLAQAFAVAFHVGATAALVVLPYISDPAFGWRSRLLDPPQVQRIAGVLSAPWSGLWPAARPSLEQVEATRYSSLDPRMEHLQRETKATGVWAAWWPFLLASFGLYGLLPRLVWLTLASVRARTELANARLDHAGYSRLCARLRRLQVDTRGIGDDDADGSAPKAVDEGAAVLRSPTHVLRWSGVRGSDAELERELAARFGVEVRALQAVGGAEIEADDAALATLGADSPQSVALVVAAWDPPVADHYDLLDRIRERVGDGVPLVVVLAGSDGAHVELWRRELARRPDPWRTVASLEGAPAS